MDRITFSLAFLFSVIMAMILFIPVMTIGFVLYKLGRVGNKMLQSVGIYMEPM